jgi:xylan 1,4-beta-xylosidase
MDTLGSRLAFFSPGEGYLERARYGRDGLVVKGSGTNAADSSPIAFIAGDHSYEIRVEVDLEGEAQAGLLVFYSPRWCCGLGYDAKRLYSYQAGVSSPGAQAKFVVDQRFHLKLVNNDNVVSCHHSPDGKAWTLDFSAEVSGYNHNIAGGFLSLRPALYVSGNGSAKFRSLQYAGKNSMPGEV